MVTGPTQCNEGLTPSPWQRCFSMIIGIVLMRAARLWDPKVIVSPYWDRRALSAEHRSDDDYLLACRL